MFVASLYNSVKNRIFVLVIVAGCLVRLVTNYLYGIHYLGPDAEWWADVYYRGQQWFEMLVLIGAAMIVRAYLNKKFYLTVAFFMDLAIFAWVKEYFLNPLQWQPFEGAGFVVSTLFLIFRLLITEKRMSAIRNKIKLVFR